MTPTAGLVAGGTAVTITGTGFAAGASVTIGGPATGVTVVSPTSITATTPANPAGVVDIVVTNPGGLSGRQPAGYTYACLPAPTGLRTSSASIGGQLALLVLWDAVPDATSFVFEMGTAPGATTFSVEVSPSASGGGGVIVGGGLGDPYRFTFVRGTSYFIRVRAKNQCGSGLTSIELQRDYT